MAYLQNLRKNRHHSVIFSAALHIIKMADPKNIYLIRSALYPSFIHLTLVSRKVPTGKPEKYIFLTKLDIFEI